MATNSIAPGEPENHRETTPAEYLTERDVLALLIGKLIVTSMEEAIDDANPQDQARAALDNLPRLDNDDDLWRHLAAVIRDDYDGRLKTKEVARAAHERQATIEVAYSEYLPVAHRAPNITEEKQSLLVSFTHQLLSANLTLDDPTDARMLQVAHCAWSSCDRLLLTIIHWPTELPVTLQDAQMAFEASEQPCNFPAGLQYFAENIDNLTPGAYLLFGPIENRAFLLVVDGKGEGRRLQAQFAETWVEIRELVKKYNTSDLPTYVITAEPPPAA